MSPRWNLARGWDDHPLVGREREVEALARVLAAVEEDAVPRFVLLSGEAGIGKSRIAGEFAEDASDRPADVIMFQARVDDALSIPLWRKIATSLGSEGPAGESARLSQAEIDQATIRLLDTAGLQRPVALIIDDAQWLNYTDANLLRRLAANPEERSALLLLVSYREGTSGGDPGLQSLLADLAREPSLTRLTLQPLTRVDVGRYLQARLGGDVPEWLASSVHERTEGNPFLLTEVASLLRAAADGEYETSLQAIPEGVRQVLEYRLSALPRESVSLLALAAVAGPVFDVALLASMEGWHPGRVLTSLDAPARERMIREVTPSKFRFCHSLLRETLLAQMSPAERTQAHAQVADALEAHGAGDEIFQLAHHYAACAVLDEAYARKALAYLTQAAQHAEQRADWESAARCHEEIVDRASVLGLGSTSTEYLHAFRQAGHAWRLAGQPKHAWTLLMRGIEAARQARDADEVAVCTIEALTGSDAAPDRRRQLAMQALEDGEALPPETRARLLVLLAGYETTPDAAAPARQARRLVERHRLSELCVGLPDRDHYEALAAGDLMLARAHAERAAALAARAGDRVAETRYMNRVGELAARAGLLGEAWGIAEQTLALAERSRLRSMADHARFTLMSIALAQGRLEAFDELSREVADSPLAWQLRARRLELTGEHQAALRRLSASEELRTEHPRVSWDFHGTAARLAHGAGLRSEARIHLSDWIRRRPENHHPVDRQDSPAVIGAALAALGDPSVARDVLDESERSSMARFSYTCATGLDVPRGQLALRLGEYGRARAHLSRALEWAVQEELAGEASSALEGLAGLPAGYYDEALRDLAEAASRVAESLETQVSLPAVSGGSLGASTSLSHREVEVLALIAEGHTNRQVARLLSISQHTVARHVSNILVKTGASNRAQAAAQALSAGFIAPSVANSKN